MKNSRFACIALAIMAITGCATGSRDTIPAMVINNESFATIPVSTPILFIDNKKVNLPPEYKENWPPELPGVITAPDVDTFFNGFTSQAAEFYLVTVPKRKIAQINEFGAAMAIREQFFTEEHTTGMGTAGQYLLQGTVLAASVFIPGSGSAAVGLQQGIGSSPSNSATTLSSDISRVYYDVMYPDGKKAIYHCGHEKIFDCRAKLTAALKNRH